MTSFSWSGDCESGYWIFDLTCTDVEMPSIQTESTLLTFMLAMVRHPEVARRAQVEIDEAIGRDRLPTLDDRGSLPYIDCIVKETLRWNPPTPLGMPY